MRRKQPPFLPLATTSLAARLEAMRASGMSATAIRRALGLSETEAFAYGLLGPGLGRAGLGRAGLGRAGLGRAGPERAGPGPNGPERAGPGPNGPGRAGTGGARLGRARARETPNLPRPGRPAAEPRRAQGAGLSGPRMIDVVDAVAQACGLGRKELLGRGQARPLARGRQLAMHLVRELCPGVSLSAIGYLLNRDHSTVLYGLRRAEARLARDTAFRTLRERLRRGLAS